MATTKQVRAAKRNIEKARAGAKDTPAQQSTPGGGSPVP